MKSYYVLEMFVGPGGSREALVFISGEREEIKRVLRAMMGSAMNLYHLVFYGQDVRLSTYQDGEQISSLDLLPKITVCFKGISLEDQRRDARVRFDPDGSPHGIDAKGKRTKEEISWDSPDWSAVSDRCFGGELVEGEDFEVIVDLDLDRELPALSGDLLRRGDDDEVRYHSHYYQRLGSGTYGAQDEEQGEHYGDFDRFLARLP
jgi:hypothetical protein